MREHRSAKGKNIRKSLLIQEIQRHRTKAYRGKRCYHSNQSRTVITTNFSERKRENRNPSLESCITQNPISENQSNQYKNKTSLKTNLTLHWMRLCKPRVPTYTSNSPSHQTQKQPKTHLLTNHPSPKAKLFHSFRKKY